MSNSLPQTAPPGFQDHVFKSIHNIDLSLRIWPARPQTNTSCPFVLWVHGGAYVVGTHFTGLEWMHEGFVKRDYHLVACSYRLAPQARHDEALEDCVDAMKWCWNNLGRVLGEEKVDVNRFVVVGDSAGGSLAGMLGHVLDPAPKAVVDVYGVMSFEGLGWLNPLDQVKDVEIPPWKGTFSHAELESFLDDRDPANLLTFAPSWIDEFTEEQVCQAWGIDFASNSRIRKQSELHAFCNARRARSGNDRLRSVMHPEMFASRAALEAFVASQSPLRCLRGKTTYPATAFLHGAADSVVSVRQSMEMARALRDIGVATIECYEEGMDHCFDSKYTDPDVPGWEQFIQPVLEFVDLHVNNKV